ncbi:MAG: hypothetical protein IJT76_00610 [Clostridia bacterium]|nr:hypothetical protein [Clostridia bacterium]
MKREKAKRLNRALQEIDDAYLEEAAPRASGKPRRSVWLAAAAAVLCLALILPAALSRHGAGGLLIAAPDYPSMAPYPKEDSLFFDSQYTAWSRDLRTQTHQPAGYADGLEAFFSQSIPVLLTGEAGENRVCSPLTVYMALAVSAELANGESRQQLLSLLGVESIEALRAQAKAVWNSNYRDDGAVKRVLASALWLSDDVDYVPETLQRLADTYYASSYRGEMGSAAMNDALHRWLNEQTDGLLEEQAADLELDPRTLLALTTTVAFRCKWVETFPVGATKQGVFHSPDGDRDVDYMRRTMSDVYYWGAHFSAVSHRLEDGEMWFLLPGEGASPEDLLRDDEVMAFLLGRSAEWENQKYLTVNKILPKFDAASDIDLIEGLKLLGVTDVFDSNWADFSPTAASNEGAFFSQIKHAARVSVDEEGCAAVAFTALIAPEAGMPPDEEVDFILDRPFLFLITGQDGLPLFTGIVNRP